MASPFGEDSLEDVPIDDFKRTTLQLDPTSSHVSRSVTPSTPCNSTQPSESFIRNGDFTPVIGQLENSAMEIVTPVTPDQAGLYYCGYGFNRSFDQAGNDSRHRRSSWHADSGIDHGFGSFFSTRGGALEQSITECTCLIDANLDGEVKGVWLLTEINHWDIERERVVFLCQNSLLIIKYDFIALRHIEYSRIALTSITELQIGPLTYPDRSLVPRINGIAGGVVTVIRGCLLNRLQSTFTSWKNAAARRVSADATANDRATTVPPCSALSTVSFEPRARNMQGLRITWNQVAQVSLTQKWNPWCREIPYTTFTSHPLYWYSGCENSTYDAKNLAKEIRLSMEDRPDALQCQVTQGPVMIENYVGLASLLHNASELGFFKLRGKVSF